MPSHVAGFYCLAAGSLRREATPGTLSRNQPDRIPVILLGRLAVDLTAQGAGLGAALLQDAVICALTASTVIGARAVIVDALCDDAAAFYRRFGFTALPGDRRRLYLGTGDARRTITDLT